MNIDRPILSATKCKTMTLVSRNIRLVYADIRGDEQGHMVITYDYFSIV